MQLQRLPHKQQPQQNRLQQPRPLQWPQLLMLWLIKHPLLFLELLHLVDNRGHKLLHNNLDNLGQWHQVKSGQEHQVKSDPEHQVK